MTDQDEIRFTIERDLAHRAAGEELWLWRRRQPAANHRVFGKIGAVMSQEEAASKLGISIAAYVDLEDGRANAAYVDLEDGRVDSLPSGVNVIPPSPNELCRLARRRSRLALDAVAAAMGVSKVTLHRYERIADPALVRFWEVQGYMFPALDGTNAREEWRLEAETAEDPLRGRVGRGKGGGR